MGLAEMASSLVEAVRSAIPLPAASLLQLPALHVAHVSGDVADGSAQPHLLAHVPFAAMLAAGAFAVYCLTRLTLSLVRYPELPLIRFMLTSTPGSASSVAWSANLVLHVCALLHGVDHAQSAGMWVGRACLEKLPVS